MSYIVNQQKKNSATIEWAAMFIGVFVIVLSTYLIFGTNWNAYMVLNVVLGLGFIVFLTYSFVNSKNLKTDLAFHRRAQTLHEELEKSLKRLSETELEVKEKALQIEKMRVEVIGLEEKLSGLKHRIAELQSELGTDPIQD
jgi:peptidoglycan hydrolase CwlO-like protein